MVRAKRAPHRPRHARGHGRASSGPPGRHFPAHGRPQGPRRNAELARDAGRGQPGRQPVPLARCGRGRRGGLRAPQHARNAASPSWRHDGGRRVRRQPAPGARPDRRHPARKPRQGRRHAARLSPHRRGRQGRARARGRARRGNGAGGGPRALPRAAEIVDRRRPAAQAPRPPRRPRPGLFARDGAPARAPLLRGAAGGSHRDAVPHRGHDGHAQARPAPPFGDRLQRLARAPHRLHARGTC